MAASNYQALAGKLAVIAKAGGARGALKVPPPKPVSTKPPAAGKARYG